MPAPLKSSRRSELRAEAHKLRPVVLIGDKGLTPEVLAEIDRSLRAHELIKVKAAPGDRAAREAWMGEICARLEAHPVQSIGKVLVIFRANPEPEKPARIAKPAKVRPAKPEFEPRAKPAARSRRPTPASGKPDFGPRKPGFGKRKPGTDSGKPAFGRRKAGPDSGAPAFGRRKPGPIPGTPASGSREPDTGERATGSARRRSRTPSPLPASGPRRRRPSTSR